MISLTNMLFTQLAYFSLLFALVLSFISIIVPSYGVFSHRSALYKLAPTLAWWQFIALAISFVGLMLGFYFNDFSLVYIAQHSNALLPWYYKLSATWSGHEGSLLLWITILAGWTAGVASFQHKLPPSIGSRVLIILSGILFMMLLLLVFSSSPFEQAIINPSKSSTPEGSRLYLPVDGADLNPLLQDFGLIVHPPMLYMGYVGMAVPFAFFISALWAGRLDTQWIRWSRPWVLTAWGFLTLGIGLGSWWAYYELGWGGWWFWDPVENASLLPWLACTALLHSLAVSEKRGSLKAWSIMLAILAFALSLLGTFLVRSGVISSVHAFASDPTRGVLLLVILAVVIGLSLLLFAIRGWQLSVDSHYQLRSRETLLVVNNIIILVATLVVFIGTLYPIISDAIGWEQVSVGSPYFNTLFVPLSWLLLLVMGMGVVTRWQRDKRPFIGVALAISTSCIVCTAILVYVFKVNALFNISVTLALCLWVVGWSIYDIRDSLKNSPSFLIGLTKKPLSYWGMHLAHLGVLIMAIGIAMNTSQSIEKNVAMTLGDRQTIAGYQITLTDLYPVKQKNYDATVAKIVVDKVNLASTNKPSTALHSTNHNQNKPIAILHPEKRTYLLSTMPMTESAIDATLWRDIYVALGEPIKQTGTTKLPNQPISEQASKQTNHLTNRQQWAIHIYIKPFVRWIWLGAILMALGGFISALDKWYR